MYGNKTDIGMVINVILKIVKVKQNQLNEVKKIGCPSDVIYILVIV